MTDILGLFSPLVPLLFIAVVLQLTVWAHRRKRR